MKDTRVSLVRNEKDRYYPYPPLIVEALAYRFILSLEGTVGRLLDLCAGEGEIASLLCALLNCKI